MSIATRASGPELLDGDEFERAEYETTLREIEKINSWTNAYAPTIDAVARASRLAPGRRLRVLDLGFGYGDTLRRLHDWSQSAGVSLELSGIDLNPDAAALARAATPASMNIRYLTGDVFELGGQSYVADVIINSLFAHHLDDAQVVRVLAWMTAHAKVAWFVSDLHRHVIPYHFIRLATRALGYNRLVRNDAPLSVARAFVRSDWLAYLDKAEIPRVSTTIRWHLPFRYGVFCDAGLARA